MPGILWRGHRACQCVIDATAQHERRTKKPLPRIFQVSYSFAKASAGTHSGGGALDSESMINSHILSARKIGFWPSDRYRSQGFDPHAHWVLFGCPHAPAGLRFQESELRAGRNGLANRGRDTFPRPARIITFRQYQAEAIERANLNKQLVIMGKTHPPVTAISMKWLAAAWKTGGFSRHVYWVQVWLRRLGYYTGPLDGRRGKVTQGALDNFRKNTLRWKDYTGAPGLDSITRLGSAAGSVLPVKA